MGYTEKLFGLDFSVLDLTDVHRLGQGAGFYLAHLFRDLGRGELFEPFLTTEWENGDGVFRKIAGQTLMTYYLQAKKYPLAEKLGSLLIEEYPENAWMRFSYLESIYWQHQSQKALEEIDQVTRAGGADFSLQNQREMMLMKAASMARASLTGWREAFVDLFLNQPASGLHIRASGFLKGEDNRIERFSNERRLLFSAIESLASNRFAESAEQFTVYLKNAKAQTYSVWLLKNAAAAYEKSGDFERGIQVFELLETNFKQNSLSSNQLVLYLNHSIGRLLRKNSRYYLAARRFEKAVSVAEGQEKQRALWYLLDSTAKYSTESVLSLIKTTVADWSDFSYFADLLDELITKMVQSSSGETLLALQEIVSPFADADTAARLAGISLLFGGKKPGEPPSSGVGRYYQVMAAVESGEIPLYLAETAIEPEPPSPAISAPDELDILVGGFLDYHLVDDALAAARGGGGTGCRTPHFFGSLNDCRKQADLSTLCE